MVDYLIITYPTCFLVVDSHLILEHIEPPFSCTTMDKPHQKGGICTFLVKKPPK